MSYDNTDRALATSTTWEKPAYEIIELGSEVTGYIYTDGYRSDAIGSLAMSARVEEVTQEKGA